MCMVDPAPRVAEGMRMPGTSVLWVAASYPSPRVAPSGRRLRFRRWAEMVWLPIDAVLAARDLSNLLVITATLTVAIPCAYGGGLTSLIMNLPALAVVWGAVYGLIRMGRWWRGVRPPEHEPPCRHR